MIRSLLLLTDGLSSVSDPLLSIDLRQTIDNASHILPWQQLPDLKLKSNGNGDQRSDLMADTKNSRDHLGLVRLLLAHAVTFGIDEGADQALVDHLEIIRPVGITETILSKYVPLRFSYILSRPD